MKVRQQDNAPWALLLGSPIPLVAYLDNRTVIVTTGSGGEVSAVQVHEGSRICWATGNVSHPATVRGARAIIEEDTGIFDVGVEYLGRGGAPLERGDQQWMLGVMRYLQSPRHQSLRSWFKAPWQEAKTLICQAVPFEIAGARVWWGASLLLKFKQTEEGMRALHRLDSLLKSCGGGLQMSRFQEIDLETTLASGGEWLAALAISQRSEYTITLTANFSEETVAWLTAEIVPALEQPIEVI